MIAWMTIEASRQNAGTRTPYSSFFESSSIPGTCKELKDFYPNKHQIMMLDAGKSLFRTELYPTLRVSFSG
jgi:hypothetical protein